MAEKSLLEKGLIGAISFDDVHHPQVILAGRKTNDNMGKFVAEQTVKRLVSLGHPVSGAKVTILGLTFKEDCPDLRNSRVVDIIAELRDYCCDVQVHDPLADPQDARDEYGIELVSLDELVSAHAVVLAVPHLAYRAMSPAEFHGLMVAGGTLMDVRSVVDASGLRALGTHVWRL